VTAVWDLDLDIAAGEIYGLIGPNGAGKTSTIKALAGVLEPTYGEIRLAGVGLSEPPRRLEGPGVVAIGVLPGLVRCELLLRAGRLQEDLPGHA